jgi:hypothetical protein
MQLVESSISAREDIVEKEFDLASIDLVKGDLSRE